MAEIKIQEGESIENALRRFKRKVQQEDIISAVKQHQPAVILMDLALRRKGGIDYINDLKGDPATKDVPRK